MASQAADTRAEEHADRAQDSASFGLVGRMKDQSGKLVELGVAKIVELADVRKDNAVDKLDAVADVVRNFAEAAEGQFGPAVGRTVRRGSGAIDGVAQTLRDRSISDMAQDSHPIIARYPATAIGAVSLLGFVAGRVAKGGLARSAHQPRRAPTSKKEAAI